MTDPYENKPRTLSEPDEWHEISFQISVDHPVDWDKYDLKKWSALVAKYTAMLMAETTEDSDSDAKVKACIREVKVDRIRLVSDDSLHQMIDEFDLD